MDLTPEQIELRQLAALAARELLESARKHDDVRMMIAEICSRTGHTNLLNLADADPDAVIDLADAVALLDEGDFDRVMR